LDHAMLAMFGIYKLLIQFVLHAVQQIALFVIHLTQHGQTSTQPQLVPFACQDMF